MSIEVTMNIKLAQADIPTLNGRIYPKDELEKAIKKRDEYYVICGTSIEVPNGVVRLEDVYDKVSELPNGTIRIEDIVGKVSELAMTEQGTVTGKIKVLKTPKGEALTEVMQHAYFNPVFTGTVSLENGVNVVRDISMLYISLDSTSSYVYPTENK
jgi:hypothetical protein